MDPSDVALPSGWKVRRSKGRMEGKFLYNSPDGKYFHSLVNVIEYLLDKSDSSSDVDIIKSNLRYEGWKEVEYLPAGWLVCYYKPSDSFHYLSPDCEFFKSAKSLMDYMKSDSYDTKIIKAIKQEMIEAKNSTGKIKFKWEGGNETLPEGWKIR